MLNTLVIYSACIFAVKKFIRGYLYSVARKSTATILSQLHALSTLNSKPIAVCIKILEVFIIMFMNKRQKTKSVYLAF